MKRSILASILIVCLLMGLAPLPVRADEPERNGYEESAGVHRHTRDCYQTVTNCLHSHTEECYPPVEEEQKTPEEPESKEPEEDEGTGESGESGSDDKAEKTGGTDETEGSASKAAPSACTHVCTMENGCIVVTDERVCGKEAEIGDSVKSPDTPLTPAVPAPMKAPSEPDPQTEKAGGRAAIDLYAPENWTGGRPKGEPLADGDTVSMDETLVLEYEFVLTVGNMEAMAGAGKFNYEIPCPDGLKWPEQVSKPEEELFYTNEEGQSVKFATLKYGTERTEITFENLSEKPEFYGVDQAFFYLGCQLDEEKLNPPAGPEEYPFQLGEGKALTLHIAENAAKASGLEGKSGTYSSGIFTWTVKYVPGNKEKDTPLKLTDEFDAAYHDYVEGSFQAKYSDGSSLSIEEDSLAVTKGSGRTRLAYTLPEAKEGEEARPITFYLQDGPHR